MHNTHARPRILVVEDDIPIQQVLCFFLNQSGFDALGVSDGREAIRLIPDFAPDLIILDLMLRPVSGWDVLHWLQTCPTPSRIPVLIVSALVHLAEQLRGYEQGAIEYLTKPTQPSIIVERVRAILALNAEQRQLLQHKGVNERRKTLEALRGGSDAGTL